MSADSPAGPQDDDIAIHVDGARLVTARGRPVRLRGVGLGGWLNMENFITGYPSTETLQRQALRAALGPAAYEAFFERFYEAFFDEPDAAFLASLGLNCVRIAVNYRHFEDDARPRELKPDGLRRLDRVIDLCARHGLYTILDLHAAPGFQNQRWHSDNPTHVAFFWTHRDFQDRAVWLWEVFADRYKDNPWVAGYNPLNEPSDDTRAVIGPFYRRVHDAIRAIDPHTTLFLDGNRHATEFDVFGAAWRDTPNIVYTVHDYALPGFPDGGGYPGVTRGQYVDRAAVEARFLQRAEYMRRTGTPIWVGEFGPVYTGDPARDDARYRLLRDQLAIYDTYDAGWSLWTYKDIGLQGLVHADPASPYLTRIAPVLAKKARLGVDSWGSTDDGVRDVLAPIERTVAAEFPDFDPPPFGAKQWIAVLVRHILLAEPLAEEFGRCFAGVDVEQARALADSFRFDRSLIRRPLADTIQIGPIQIG